MNANVRSAVCVERRHTRPLQPYIQATNARRLTKYCHCHCSDQAYWSSKIVRQVDMHSWSSCIICRSNTNTHYFKCKHTHTDTAIQTYALFVCVERANTIAVPYIQQTIQQTSTRSRHCHCSVFEQHVSACSWRDYDLILHRTPSNNTVQFEHAVIQTYALFVQGKCDDK